MKSHVMSIRSSHASVEPPQGNFRDIMDELFENLKKEAECRLCLYTVNEPKTLPCLHSFCLKCLDELASFERRKLKTTINCPLCLKSFQIPEGHSFFDLPTSFHLNQLVDILALRDGSPEAQTCSNCEENSTATRYCFVCQIILCAACFEAHQRLRASRDHRNVLIQNMQAQDVEELIHRPVRCTQRYHEKEALEYYCRECKHCICHKCSVVSHNRHTMVDIRQAAAEQRMQMMNDLENMKAQIAVCEEDMKEGEELLERCREEIFVSRKKVRATVEGRMRGLMEHETAMMVTLDDLGETQERCHATHHKNYQLFTTQLRSSVEYGEAILERNVGVEVLQTQGGYAQRCEELQAEKLEIYKPPHVCYVTNREEVENVPRRLPGQIVAGYTDPTRSVAEGNGLEETEVGRETNFTIETRNSEGRQLYYEHDQVMVRIRTPSDEDMEKKNEDNKTGKYTVTYTSHSVGQHEVVIKVNDQPLTGSPWSVQVTPHKYETVLTFGSRGKGQGDFDWPFGIAVSKKTGNIAVSDYLNHRIQIFTSDGKYLGEFGLRRIGAERPGEPGSVAFGRRDVVIVTHSNRISLYTESGLFIKQVFNRNLKAPWGVSVGHGGRLIVCDYGDKTIKVLSPDGAALLQSFSAPDCDKLPSFTVYHQGKFFVSYSSAHCVKVFSKDGVFLYTIGSEGSGDGQLTFPGGLAVDNFNNVIVCDHGNRRLQVFTLDGTFVTKIDQQITRLGVPLSVAVSQDGHVFVTDRSRHCVHVLRRPLDRNVSS